VPPRPQADQGFASRSTRVTSSMLFGLQKTLRLRPSMPVAKPYSMPALENLVGAGHPKRLLSLLGGLLNMAQPCASMA